MEEDFVEIVELAAASGHFGHSVWGQSFAESEQAIKAEKIRESIYPPCISQQE